jgi:Peptidase family M28
MLNWRLYRATFVPFLVALGVAAFSLGARPQPLTSTLAPDAFNGALAFAELKRLAAEFPDRRPGSAGDQRLAARVAQTLEGLGGAGHGGFQVRTRRLQAQTIDGEKTLETVIAQRPGSSGGRPVVIMAHRDAAARGSEAELSGTAALLELARVFGSRETQRTIVLVSTSGGSGGDGGAADFAASDRGSPGVSGLKADAAIVLGDVAGVSQRKPFVVPYSDGFGSAPEQLQRTVAGAITQELGSDAGTPGAIAQLAHLVFPFAVGEQGALNASGLPAVLVQVSGEGGPPTSSPREKVSEERMEGLGRAVLNAVDALDVAPDISSAPQAGVLVTPKVIPQWALRLLIGALLLGPLILCADGYARLRRRRGRAGEKSLRRGLGWVLSCALPFFVAAVFARLLGWLGVLQGAPAMPVPASGLTLDGAAYRALLALALVLGLGWLAWPRLMARLGYGVWGDPEGAGLALLVAVLGLGMLVWVLNPYATLLLVGALHLWAALADPELRPRRAAALALVALALVPLGLLIVFYSHELGAGPAVFAWEAVLLLAGGHVGVAAAACWSVACGCGVAAMLLALAPLASSAGSGNGTGAPVTIRGPLSYAGPGSLGGTESALRR